ILTSCNQKKYSFAIVKYQKTHDFGEITLKDTVNYIFKIKNISKVDFKIRQIGTGCGCTAAIIKDSIISENETTEIHIKYIPKKQDKGIGLIKNSIVIDGNTNPPFTTFYLTGKVN
ncbi:MAG: DUF1573 domain-containing protein, partial [Flavobacterium sp.]|uniref:DUF1573 domain-containing protein n=1 Tax=Flavobacterium sp. TaxID=239 RepID=UPI0026276F65